MYIGIDVGAKKLDVAVLHVDQIPTKAAVFSVALDHGWDMQLADLVDGARCVAMEPTGVYSRPLLSFFASYPSDDLPVLEVSHAVTKRYREAYISDSKTDKNDARALALIARDVHNMGRDVRGVRPTSLLTDELRLLVNWRRAAVKEQTRTYNRLKSLAAGVDPALANRLDTWLRADLVHPDDFSEFVAAAEKLEIEAFRGSGSHMSRKALLTMVSSTADTAYMTTVQRVVAHNLHDRLRALSGELDHCERLMVEVCERINPNLFHAWSSLKGSSLGTVAALMVACRGSVQGFSVDEFRAVVGWRPVRQQSGNSDKSSAARVGYKPAKVGVYMWVFSLVKYDNEIGRYFTRSGSVNRIAATCGKMCRMLYGVGVRAENGEVWYDFTQS